MKEVPAKLLSGRIAILDGFRGLAILLVIGYHYSDLFSFGWIGVDLFFILSGFLITGKLLDAAGSKNYFTVFYLKRALRIMPLYFLVLLLFFVAIPLLSPSAVTASYATLIKLQGYYWTFTLNFYEAFHGWPDNITLVPLWSLACEMQFYFIWPFVVLLIWRWKKTYLFAALIAFIFFALLFRVFGNYVGFPSGEFRYILLPSRIDAFAFGALLSVCIKNGWMLQMLKNGWMLSLLSLLAAVIMMLSGHHVWSFGETMISQYGYTVNAFFWSGIFASVWFGSPALVKLFSSKWLTITGKYSYGMYIIHVPVKVVMMKFFKDGWLPAYATIILSVVITFCCAFICYHTIEKRFLSLKDNLDK